MVWPAGRFVRQRIPPPIRALTPYHAAHSIVDIDLAELWSRGKRLILLDVDYTIVIVKRMDPEPEVLEWLNRAKAMGFFLYLISNTTNEDRLERIRVSLGVKTVRGKSKPNSEMYVAAMASCSLGPEATLMIGDQLFTDILGANKCGVESYWVKAIPSRHLDISRVHRILEFPMVLLFKALVAPKSK